MTRIGLVPVFLPVVLCGLGCAAISGLASFDETGSSPPPNADGGSDTGVRCGTPLIGKDVWIPSELKGLDNEKEAFSNVIDDVDGDGHQDIVYASQLSRNLNVFYGHGDGTFDPLINYPANVRFGHQGPAIGDLDGDGRLDVVLSSEGDLAGVGGPGPGLFIVPGAASRGFTATKAIGESENPTDVEVVDANNDGAPDIVVTLSTGPKCTAVRLNIKGANGAFAFESAACVSSPALQRFRRFDVEGDGRSELLVRLAPTQNNPASRLAIGRFGANGTTLETTTIHTKDFADITYFKPIKLNDDGFGDFIVAGARDQPSELFGFYGRGDGTFDECLLATSVPTFRAAGYLHGDGIVDLTDSSGPSASEYQFYVMIQR